MTASLYQSPSCGSGPDSAAGSGAVVFTSFILRLDSLCTGVDSQVVVEILLAAHAPPQSEHMRGRALRVKHDVVMPAPPDVALLAQEVMHLVRLIGIEFQC